MNIGYIRVSTTNQNSLRQEVELKKICNKLFIEKASGENALRPVLLEMLEFIREGDVLHFVNIPKNKVYLHQ